MRSEAVRFRVSPVEREALRAHAEARGRTVSDWARWVLLQQVGLVAAARALDLPEAVVGVDGLGAGEPGGDGLSASSATADEMPGVDVSSSPAPKPRKRARSEKCEHRVEPDKYCRRCDG